MRHYLALLLAALLAACSTTAPTVQSTASLFHDSAFGTPAKVPSAAEVFGLNAAMKDYLHVAALPTLRLNGLQNGLVDALYSKRHLALDYDADRTRTASEAFDARAGNCLSLVIMTAAFAKELGLRVRYQMVESAGIWDHAGDLVFNIGHVNVALGRATPMSSYGDYWADWLTVDFMAAADNVRARSWPIEEKRVMAMYLNNRAAENLALGRVEEAYWWARAAVLEDADFVDAFNTLGVVYQRHGDAPWAEAALRQALALQPNNPHALGNLVAVVKGQGREDESRELLARLRRLQPAIPFQQYAQGMQALRAGDYAKARDLLEKELLLSKDHHEVHFGLAVAYFQLGDAKAAGRHLKLARDNSMTRQQQALYGAKLAALQRADAAH